MHAGFNPGSGARRERNSLRGELKGREGKSPLITIRGLGVEKGWCGVGGERRAHAVWTVDGGKTEYKMWFAERTLTGFYWTKYCCCSTDFGDRNNADSSAKP